MNQQEYFAIFDQFSDGVLAADADGTIIYYNPAMSKIDELAPEDVIGRNVTEVYDLDHERSLIMQCLTSQTPIVDRPIYYKTHRGKLANTIHNVIPMFDNGKLLGAVCIVRDYRSLVASLDTMPKAPESQENTRYSKITFETLRGQNPAFNKAKKAAILASDSPSPVMLLGETGTGKELFAQAIHNQSRRRNYPFIPINCAAIPENLLEGLLFGTEEGAFTGAVKRAGLFEQAHNGTLFLDEVNSMPVTLQSRLLRALQEKRIRRVGSLTEINVNLKIISSVNQPLHAAISRGSLRADLFYRLGVVLIQIVPLRKRMEDLAILVDYFIRKHNAILNRCVRGISARVMKQFQTYHWPGNVRELEHVIEGAMNIMGSCDLMETAHLSPLFVPPPQDLNSNEACELPSHEMNRHIPKTAPPKKENETAQPLHKHPVTENNQETEKIRLVEALSHTGGNISRTAKALGISRQLLYYRMKKYNITKA